MHFASDLSTESSMLQNSGDGPAAKVWKYIVLNWK